MTLYCNGHTYKYELENLIKMFFPLIKLGIVYNGQKDDPNAVVTDYVKTPDGAALSVTIDFNGTSLHREAFVLGSNPNMKAECERVFGLMIYELLNTLTGIAPKWGILTGIRPVKLVTGDVEQGVPDEAVVASMHENYLVDPKKAELLIEIAKLQSPVIKSIGEKDYSLYISIPFCPSRCSYCSFVSHSVERAKKLIPDYLAALERELEVTGAIANRLGLTLKTVYFGGGTPTVLSAEQLSGLFKAVGRNFDCSGLLEHTVEAGRADTVTADKLEAMRHAGVTRISINPQSFNDAVLEAIGRRHTARQVIDAFHLARSLGFDNINMDLIAGLKGDTTESFRNTVETALALNPENITVHTLSVKRAANLYRDEESLHLIRDNPTSEMADLSQRMLKQAGYSPYYLYRQKNTLQNLENVGFCKPGYEGLYNIYIMEERETILAAGAGAVSKLVDQRTGRIERIFNYKFPYEYIGEPDEMLRRKTQIERFYKQIEQD